MRVYRSDNALSGAQTVYNSYTVVILIIHGSATSSFYFILIFFFIIITPFFSFSTLSG